MKEAIRIHGEGTGDPLQYSCLENPMGGGAWWAAVHGVTRSRTQLSNFTFTFHFHALEKEVATHSSVLAWRIPGTGAWWAAVYGVAQSRTRLKRLSSSSGLTPAGKPPPSLRIFPLLLGAASLYKFSGGFRRGVCHPLCLKRTANGKVKGWGSDQ